MSRTTLGLIATATAGAVGFGFGHWWASHPAPRTTGAPLEAPPSNEVPRPIPLDADGIESRLARMEDHLRELSGARSGGRESASADPGSGDRDELLLGLKELLERLERSAQRDQFTPPIERPRHLEGVGLRDLGMLDWKELRASFVWMTYGEVLERLGPPDRLPENSSHYPFLWEWDLRSGETLMILFREGRVVEASR